MKYNSGLSNVQIHQLYRYTVEKFLIFTFTQKSLTEQGFHTKNYPELLNGEKTRNPATTKEKTLLQIK
jgi:hypothetical protein